MNSGRTQLGDTPASRGFNWGHSLVSAGCQAGLRVLGCHNLHDWHPGDTWGWAQLDASPLLGNLGTFLCGLSSRGAGLLRAQSATLL